MSNDTTVKLTDLEAAQPIISALIRARSAEAVNEVLSWRPEDESVLEYVQSLADKDDIVELRVQELKARATRFELERSCSNVFKKIKNCPPDALPDRALVIKAKFDETFEEFVESQELLSSIRDDIKLIESIVLKK